MHLFHKWDKWSEPYDVKFNVYPDAWAAEWRWGKPEPLKRVKHRQQRTCLKCGQTEYRDINIP